MSSHNRRETDSHRESCYMDCWLQQLSDTKSTGFILPDKDEILKCMKCSFFNEVINRAKGRRFADQKADSILKLLLDQVVSYTSELEKKSYDLRKRVEVLTILNKVSDALLKSNDLKKSLKVILTGATAGEAFGFNRAFVFLVEDKKNILEGKMALGPENEEEASKIWSNLKDRGITFDKMIQEILDGDESPPNNLTRKIESITIPLNPDSSILARSIIEKKSFNLRNSGDQNTLDLVKDNRLGNILDTLGLAVVPIFSEIKAIGVLVADNLITHQPILEEDISALETLANQTASHIENISLQRELSLNLQELERLNKLLKDNQEYLLKHHRLADIGKLATTAAHEIKTPLIAIGGYARRALKYSSQTSQKDLEVIVKEVERLEKITSQILDYSRKPKLILKEHNINELIGEVLLVLKDKLKYQNIQVKTNLYQDLEKTKVDAYRLKQVLFNLIENGVEAMSAGGMFKIETKMQKKYVILDIEDTGTGIIEEIKEDIFMPFFSTKPNGSGMGLAVSKKIIQDHNGYITVESSPGKGTKFNIYLPFDN